MLREERCWVLKQDRSTVPVRLCLILDVLHVLPPVEADLVFGKCAKLKTGSWCNC